MSCVTNTIVFLQLAQDVAGTRPAARVRVIGSMRAERLVHQHHRRIGGERARDADALLLSAGQLARIAVAIAARGPCRRARAARRRARAMRASSQPSSRGTVAMFSRDRPVREEPDLLDHVADAAAQRRPDRRRMTSRPATVTVPASGSIIRLMMRIVVVLPQPDGPISTQTSPAGTVERQTVDRRTRARPGTAWSSAAISIMARAIRAASVARCSAAEQRDRCRSTAASRESRRRGAAAAPSSRCRR